MGVKNEFSFLSENEPDPKKFAKNYSPNSIVDILVGEKKTDYGMRFTVVVEQNDVTAVFSERAMESLKNDAFIGSDIDDLNRYNKDRRGEDIAYDVARLEKAFDGRGISYTLVDNSSFKNLAKMISDYKE